MILNAGESYYKFINIEDASIQLSMMHFIYRYITLKYTNSEHFVNESNISNKWYVILL